MEGTNVYNGRQSALNLTASKVIKAVPGKVGTLIVNPTSSGTIDIYDVTSITSPPASKLIFGSGTITGTVAQVYDLNFPCLVGITVVITGTVNASLSFD